MNLQEILKKESVNENDIKILIANINNLSTEDKVRFGFIEVTKVETKVEAKVESKPVEVKRTIKKKIK